MNSSSAFQFQKFAIKQEQCAMKIGIDSVLLGAWCPLSAPQCILDIGTGTGILALMLAQRSKCSIDAIEIDNAAYNEAAENISASRYKHRIEVFHQALQDFRPTRLYDLIISNPPYFNATLLSHDQQRNNARHQTTLSYKELLQHSKRLLSPQGLVVFILPSESVSDIKKIADEEDLHLLKLTYVFGKKGKTAKRCLFALQSKPCTTTIEKIYIRTEDNRYSNEFQEISQDFYLPSIFR